jgi:hypothetical protein
MNMQHHIIQFIVMVIVGMLFNPMNMLAYKFSHLMSSLTLFYGGLLMASNMVWSHEIVSYLYSGMFNGKIFFTGLVMSIVIVIFLLRKQLCVTPKQWYKRMIPHHSTALTTSNALLKNQPKEVEKNPRLKKLLNDIIDTQKKEIDLMNELLQNE